MDMLKQACWLHLQTTICRYLMSNAKGRWDGAEKAQRHHELCLFYVALVKCVEEDQVRRKYEDEYQAVHTKTQELTSYLDEEIDFPLDEDPDYDTLMPKFFDKFHALAFVALQTS